MNPVCPLRLKKNAEEHIRRGYPWIFTRDLIESSELMLSPPGSLVSIETQKGQPIGTGYFNASAPIAARVLTLSREAIDVTFFNNRFARALQMRHRLIPVPYYRLVHSEADGLPGLLVDRFGDTFVVQAGTAGMEQLRPLWMESIEELFKPRAIVLRNDTGARESEGLRQEVSIAKGEVADLVEVKENGVTYLADLIRGQKTGWFFDQRDNRKMIAGLANGKTLLDVYSHSGGFGLLAAKAGAEVTLVDSSALALSIAKKAAEKNDLRCDYRQGDAFEVMQKMKEEEKQYDIVLADPPAFVKSRKDINAGLKGYEKVAKLASALVKPGGMLFVASCSHHATRPRFNEAVISGVHKAGLTAEILRVTGAAPDHPRHPLLPQSEYLKGILLKLSCK